MKHDKIISITLINAFTLLSFASLLSSCHKNSIKMKGFYSKNKLTRSRSIASVNDKTPAIDYNQVYIYCQVNSNTHKACFKHHVQKIINQVQDKKLYSGHISRLDEIFLQAEKNVALINVKIKDDLEQIISKFVQTKQKFCKENAVRDLERCLTSSLNIDSSKMANIFQDKHKNLNGHEYLYIKQKMREVSKEKLLANLNN